MVFPVDETLVGGNIYLTRWLSPASADGANFGIGQERFQALLPLFKELQIVRKNQGVCFAFCYDFDCNVSVQTGPLFPSEI